MWESQLYIYIYTGAPVNIKTSIFNMWFLRHFCVDFYATKTYRNSVKKPFSWYIIHISRFYSFQDISEKSALVGANYPWYRDAIVFIYLFCGFFLRRFQHCTGHVTITGPGSFVGGGNQYIQLVSRFCPVNCPPSVSQLPTFPPRGPGFEPPTSEVGGEWVTTVPPPPDTFNERKIPSVEFIFADASL